MNHILVNGGLTDLDDLREEDLFTVQIAKALARVNRFAGNFQSMSVAQHAVIVSNVVEKLGGSVVEQLAGLHHDDAEAFIGDVPSIVKDQCPGLVDIEYAILDVVDSKYRCETRCEMVAKADKIVSNTELLWHIEVDGSLPRMMASLADTDVGNGIGIAAKTLIAWNHEQSMAAYMDRHDDLMRELARDAETVLEFTEPKALDKGIN